VNGPIDTVFLDAGGVLVNPNWDRVSDTLARHGLHVTSDALRAVERHAWFALDTPRVAVTTDADRGGQYFNDVLNRAGVPAGAARDAALAELFAYHMEHNLWEHVADDVVDIVEQLRGAGLKLAIASNANGVLGRCLERVGLSAHFDVVCDSGLEGVEKPDARFFQILLERTGSRPETTVHVGDLYHVDVIGARNSGIRPLLLDPLGLYRAFDVDRIERLSDLPRYLRVDAPEA
jgi:putative hydrolase of the HAD superfamily